MNSVSWFIYIAQISSSLGNLFVGLALIGLIVIGIGYAAPRLSNFFEAANPGDKDYIEPRPVQKLCAGLCITSLVLGNIMPERNTMYAIAASQVGEQIVKTEIASDATKALHQWIKRQIEPETKK
jgi:hypothetical protein